ncbi:Uncharacterised protein [Mycobacteroides abscessus subsp. abscessus]|nr:Uncharacterised protein [Mycobacteroides abscessus subsp. abscessus]
MPGVAQEGAQHSGKSGECQIGGLGGGGTPGVEGQPDGGDSVALDNPDPQGLVVHRLVPTQHRDDIAHGGLFP